MTEPNMTRAEFDLLARRAGLTLNEQQKSELHGAYVTLDALIERLRVPLDPALEPATTFSTDQGRAP